MQRKEVKCPKCGAQNPIYIKRLKTYICRNEECEYEFELEMKPFSKKIFISYGHDDYAELAIKLKKDLERLGHDVWFDLEKLKAGRDWEIYIEKGLQGAEVVLSMMTPHSVRRPDGFCLDELSMARTLHKTILPIMVRDCIPPLSIHRIQWLDFRNWPCSEEIYKEKFAQIRDVIEGRLLSVEGSHSLLLNELEPLDFKVEIDKHVKKFYGREWIFEEIKDWLYKDSNSRIFFLTGKPGVGKTAISAMLCHRFPEVKAYHLVMSEDMRKSNALECVLSIAYQLSTQILDYSDQLLKINVERIREKNARTVFDELIIQPLYKIKSPSKPVLIVIDALDEGKIGDDNELVSLISNAFNLTPQWLKLFITSRPEPYILNSLASLNPYPLDTDDNRNLTDIKGYLNLQLGELFLDRDTGVALEVILERSEGVFLYIQEVLNELKMGRLDIDYPEEFPKGLKQVYRSFFKRQFPVIDDYNKYQRPLLELIVASNEPLELYTIREILDWDEYIEKHCVDPLSSFLEIEDGRVKLFHRSVSEWLIDQQTGGNFFISVKEGDKKLAHFGWNTYKSGTKQLPDYFMIYLPHHLMVLKRWDDLSKLLRDSKYIKSIKYRELRGFSEEESYFYYGLLYNATRPNEAIEYFNKALKIDPENKFYRHLKGVSLSILNRYEEAIECYDKVLKIDSEYGVSWLRKGTALESLNRNEEAIECYDTALKIDPEYKEAWFNKGCVLESLNSNEEAIECYNKALKIDPEYEDAWFYKGRVLMLSLKRYEEAIKYFDKVLEINPEYKEACIFKGLALSILNRQDEAVLCYEKVLKIDPDHKEAWFFKGSSLQNLNRYEEAVESYNKALEIDPDYKDAWNEKGGILFDLNRYEEAVECYNKALEINPEYKEAWYWKGSTLFNLNRQEEAIECYNKALEIDPEYKKAWYLKGRTLFNLNRYEEAVECYNKILEIDLEYEEVWFLKGSTLLNLNREEEAIECYDKVLEINPNSKETWNEKGGIYFNLNRHEEAVECFNKVLEIDPEYKKAWYWKGRTLFNLNRYKEAVECFNKALEIDPEYQEAWYFKGSTLYNLNRYEEAIECYNKALKIEPEYIDAWAMKGISLHNSHRYDEAERCYDKALELDINYGMAWYNKACLESLRENKEKSIQFLKKAIELDAHYKDSVKDDEDFNNIRDSIEFKELIGELKI